MYFLRCLMLVSIYMATVVSAHAATLYIDPPQQTINRGDVILLQVRIDTDEINNECINAAQGVIQFSGPLTPIDISLGESIFSLWIETPSIDEKSKQVTFAGGIPNGYCGRVAGDPELTNVLFTVVARAHTSVSSSGEREIATAAFTSQAEVILNGPSGDRATLTTLPSTITVTPNIATEVTDPWSEAVVNDTQPPQDFSIILERGDTAFNGEYYISFNTSDKQTGIDHYEVMEESVSQYSAFRWGGADAPWVRARSPYVLQDQSLNSVIRVRAVDKAGNEYITTLIPDESLQTLNPNTLAVIVLMSSFVAILLISWIVYRHNRKRKAGTQTDDDTAVRLADLDYDHEPDDITDKHNE